MACGWQLQGAVEEKYSQWQEHHAFVARFVDDELMLLRDGNTYVYGSNCIQPIHPTVVHFG
jgi:hypothetical protein